MVRLSVVVLLALGCSSAGGKSVHADAGDDEPIVDASGGGGGGKDAGAAGGMSGKDAAAVVPDSAADAAPEPPDTGPDAPATVDVAPTPMGNPFVYVGSGQSTEIRIFQLDMQTGALMARGSAPSGRSPDYLAFHPSGRYLYALNEVAAGRVEAFSINTTTGMLTKLNDASSGGAGPAHISVHKSGKWVLAANYASGHAAALPIKEDGSVGPPVAPVLAGANAHMIIDDGVTGNFVFVPAKGDNRILQYKFDVETGRLTPNTPPFVDQGGVPRHMAFHRSGRYAYLLTEAGRSVVSYKYDATTGLLSDGASVAASPSGNGAHIVLHPTKEFLYTSMRSFNSIAIFTINADGRVQGPRQFQQQISIPWDTAIDATGQFMLVANNDNGTIKVLRIDQATGALSLVGNGANVAPGTRFVGVMYPPR